jgi:aspartate aminotransferase-like enzyme
VVPVKLFTVGPVACYPAVLDAMGRQMYSHRSVEYQALHRDTVARLQAFIETEHPVFLFSSTGTGFMEACVRNCVERTMLCCVNGSFGQRFADVAIANGRDVVTVTTPLGEPTTPALLDAQLSNAPDVEAVAITHNETSVGLINPLAELADVVREHGKLLFVDAVSAMGGTELQVDAWGIDVCFSSSQKCFGVPPGLAVGSVSAEALARSSTATAKGWYFDFTLWERYQRRAGTPMTSVIPQIAGLNAVLKRIEAWGGKAAYYRRYKERNGRIRRGLATHGFTTFPRPGYESPTVTCVNAPRHGLQIYERMRARGFELAQGYGAIRASTFRIGNMGHVELEDIDAMLDALGDVADNLD